eukprot:4463276-Heterocapsa_arctica.AAC.1
MRQCLEERLHRRLLPSSTLSRPLEGHLELAIVDTTRPLPDAPQRGQQDLDHVRRPRTRLLDALLCCRRIRGVHALSSAPR